jgi:hypothetical protein
MALYVAMAYAGWPGGLDACTLPGGNCYCEAARDDPIAKQPANTWSNLAAVLAGLAILFVADRERFRRFAGENPMVGGSFYAVMYGFVVLFLGPGSMAFHGTLSRIGGWLDTLSMLSFITFILVYDGARTLRLDDRPGRFVLVWAGILAVLGAATWAVPGTGVPAFGVLTVILVPVEALIATKGLRGIRRKGRWLAFAVLSFGAALAVWYFSWTGHPLCDPNSLWQGHALWHIIAEGVTPLVLFAYLRTERRSPAASPYRSS